MNPYYLGNKRDFHLTCTSENPHEFLFCPGSNLHPRYWVLDVPWCTPDLDQKKLAGLNWVPPKNWFSKAKPKKWSPEILIHPLSSSTSQVDPRPQHRSTTSRKASSGPPSFRSRCRSSVRGLELNDPTTRLQDWSDNGRRFLTPDGYILWLYLMAILGMYYGVHICTYTTLVYVECLWNWDPKGRTPFDFIAEPQPQVAQAAPATPAG